MGGAKEWRALAPVQKKTDIWCHFTYRLQFWIMTGIFIAGTAPSFSIKRCANPASNWALFIKSSSTNTLEKLCSQKINCIHCSVHITLCYFGKLNRVSFPSQPKHTSLEIFFPSESRAVQLDEARWWLRSCSRACRCLHRRILPGEMPI